MNEQKDFITVRVLFSKTGLARYISHLDLNRAMTRAMRRAEIPLWYTEGFNRHAYLTFASPLSLGSESLCERMDIRLCEPMEPQELCDRLNAVMPQGLHILSAAPAVHKAGDLGFARYRLGLPYPRDRVEAFLAQETMPVQKKSKKGGFKTVDVRQALKDVQLSDEGDGTSVEVTLPCGGADTVGPALVVAALHEFTGDDADVLITRLELYTLSGDVFT